MNGIQFIWDFVVIVRLEIVLRSVNANECYVFRCVLGIYTFLSISLGITTINGNGDVVALHNYTFIRRSA